LISFFLLRAHLPIGWNHPIQKKLHQNNKLGDVEIEKVSFSRTCVMVCCDASRIDEGGGETDHGGEALIGFVTPRATLLVLECGTD